MKCSSKIIRGTIIVFPIISLGYISFYVYTNYINPPWKAFDGRVCTIGGDCHNSVSLQRYKYWVSQAAAKRDVTLCENVGMVDDGNDLVTARSNDEAKERSKYLCVADYAIAVGDVEFCRSLEPNPRFPSTLSQKDICLDGLARKLRQPGLCDELEYKGWEQYKENAVLSCKKAATN